MEMEEKVIECAGCGRTFRKQFVVYAPFASRVTDMVVECPHCARKIGVTVSSKYVETGSIMEEIAEVKDIE